MAKALFFLFFGLFGNVMCNFFDSRICTTDSYQAEGYAPGCTFKCLENNEERVVNYRAGTFCFVNREDETLQHLGHCENGVCVPENRGPGGSLPHQWDAEYHGCNDVMTDKVVKNCTYVCKKDRQSWELPLYFYGVYEGKCELDGETGICRSGVCHSGNQFPQIDK
uniref:Putative basic tail protein n=1 Tax=Ixodes ricinus TaxID=34613 RepID=A0A0K8RBB5_IXORI